jgi:hypothetical protein
MWGDRSPISETQGFQPGTSKKNLLFQPKQIKLLLHPSPLEGPRRQLLQAEGALRFSPMTVW